MHALGAEGNLLALDAKTGKVLWSRELKKDYKIDAKRLYLTGLSMGGFGTWSLAAAHPEKWAAIAPRRQQAR